MANLQRAVVILLVVTLVLSALSVVFNLMIYNIKSSEPATVKNLGSSNSGNIGFVVEASNPVGADYGG